MLDQRDVPGTQDATVEMARLLDVPPVLVPEVLRGDTRLTQRWLHGPVHGYMHAMKGHVVVGSYSGDAPMTWRIQSRRLASRIGRKAFTLMPDGHDGHWDIAGAVTVSHVYLTEDHVQSCADEIAGGKRVELLPRVGFEDSSAAGLLEILSHEAARDSASSRLFVEQAIDLLCTRLVRGHSSFDALPAPAPRRGLADWQVRRVTNFMQSNIDQHIGLDDLAQVVGYSRFHFCTAFRQATGRTPHEWLTARRIDCARELLANPKLRITDIALAVGYETSSAFAASFRKAVGTTPTAFRRGL